MRSLSDFLFVRKRHVCPWYCCFTFDNIFRKLVQNPKKILSDYVKPGFRILDIGPGQGYFSIPMAEMVGPKGEIVAVDIQEKMVERLEKRARKYHVSDRIKCKLVKDANYSFNSEFDFALAFWMIHEVPDKENLFNSIYRALKPGKLLLVAEPLLHVTAKMFEKTREIAESTGFKVINRPKIFFSKAVVLEK
jgi:ubiquinone/menaquinone biosynthesis C-methylase UbiE